MDVDKYIELTGETVDNADKARITATIRRTRIILENMLGYSLLKKKASENQYAEKGQIKDAFLYGLGSFNVDADLLPADEVIGSYRLFPYNRSDVYLSTDPFTQLHAVKLVFVKQGEEPNGVTVRKFCADEVAVEKTRGVMKYVQILWRWYRDATLLSYFPHRYIPQVAIDADWINEECLPEDILLIWADMVTFYSDDKANIKSETLGPHSYTKFEQENPETLPENVKIIQRYAGANGSVNQMPVI